MFAKGWVQSLVAFLSQVRDSIKMLHAQLHSRTLGLRLLVVSRGWGGNRQGKQYKYCNAVFVLISLPRQCISRFILEVHLKCCSSNFPLDMRLIKNSGDFHWSSTSSRSDLNFSSSLECCTRWILLVPIRQVSVLTIRSFESNLSFTSSVVTFDLVLFGTGSVLRCGLGRVQSSGRRLRPAYGKGSRA